MALEAGTTASPTPSPAPSSATGAGAATHDPHWLETLTHYLDPTHFWGAVGLGVAFPMIQHLATFVIPVSKAGPSHYASITRAPRPN